MTTIPASAIAIFIGIAASLSSTPWHERLELPQDVPFCNYNDPILADVRVEGGRTVFTCRNSYYWPKPPGYLPGGICYYLWCNSGKTCGTDEWTETSRARNWYVCMVQPPIGPYIITGPPTDTETGNCCKCKMPDPQPIWQPD